MVKLIKASVLTFVAFMLQMTFLPYLKINGVYGNLTLAVIAVLTVALGKKYAFGSSCIIGILTEIEVGSVTGLYAVLIPVASILSALVFADMSDIRRENRRRKNKKTTDMEPHVRTILDAALIAAIIEFVLLLYQTISGNAMSANLVFRAFISIMYTILLTAIIMQPIRKFLHLRFSKDSYNSSNESVKNH